MQGNMKKIINNEKGLTLIEVMIAILLLSIIAITFMNVFLTAFDNSIKAQEVTNYTYAAQGEIEQLRTYEAHQLFGTYFDQDERTPFDTNGDGEPDCFMNFRIAPHAIPNSITNKKNLNDPVFAFLFYIGDKVLVLAENGDRLLYADAKTDPVIDIDLTPGEPGCSITVDGQTVVYERADGYADVVLSAFLQDKEAGYNTHLEVYAPSGHMYINGSGDDDVLSEFNVSKDGHLTTMAGMEYSTPFVLEIEVRLYHEETDTEPFFDLSEMIDISFEDIKDMAEQLG